MQVKFTQRPFAFAGRTRFLSRPLQRKSFWLRTCISLGFVLTFHIAQPGSVFGEEKVPESEAGYEEAFLTTEQALKELFPEAGRFEADSKELSDLQRKEIEKKLGRPLEEAEIRPVFHRVWNEGDALAGYGIVMNEKGKYRPITLLVGVTPEIRVKDVAVMVYRETRGGDVRRKRFLHQFQSKSLSDPLRVNRDVLHVSGATISSYSVTSAVRRALLLADACYSSKGEGKR